EFLAHQEMIRRQNLHSIDAKAWIHAMALLVIEVDDKLVIGGVIVLDLTEAPALVDAVVAWLHGLELGLCCFKLWLSGDDFFYGFFVHLRVKRLKDLDRGLFMQLSMRQAEHQVLRRFDD